MKYIKAIIAAAAAILFAVPLSAAAQFNSYQVGIGPTNGKVLQTNGSTNTWVATSSLGISGGSGSSSVGPINVLQASNGSGGFIATGTPTLTVGNVVATSTASSTWSGGIDVPRICLTGTTSCLGAAITPPGFFSWPWTPVTGGNATTSIMYDYGGWWTNAASSTCYTSCVLNMYGSISNNQGFNSGNVYINDSLQIANNLVLPNLNVMSWNNNAMTLTHSTGVLTLAGGNFVFASSTNQNRFISGSFMATSTTATSTLEEVFLNNQIFAKVGANKSFGTTTLSGGTVTVNNTRVRADSMIYVSNCASAGTIGAPYVSAQTAATSFVITSTNGSDTSVICWRIVQPIY